VAIHWLMIPWKDCLFENDFSIERITQFSYLCCLYVYLFCLRICVLENVMIHLMTHNFIISFKKSIVYTEFIIIISVIICPLTQFYEKPEEIILDEFLSYYILNTRDCDSCFHRFSLKSWFVSNFTKWHSWPFHHCKNFLLIQSIACTYSKYVSFL
jgi:hypothetical protein